MSMRVAEAPQEEHRFLFEPPVVVEIPSKRKYSPVNQNNTDDFTMMPIRMASVYSNPGPYRPPSEPQVPYLLPQIPTTPDLNEYFRIQEINGFGEGAVVTRRYQPTHSFKYTTGWGIIINSNCYPRMAPWGPFQVRWLNPPFQNKKYEFEGCWAEDLVVIHSNLSKAMIIDLCEAQGVAAE